MRRIYVDKYTGRIERTDLYLVRLTMKNGTVYEDLEPKRLFPFSKPNMYITLLDAEEKELGFVRDLEELDDASRAALEECFSEYYLIPKITRLLTCEDKFGTVTWEVETDRGYIKFQIKNRQHNIKPLHGTKRVMVRDSNDNRYEIVDHTKLDAHSRHILFSYL